MAKRAPSRILALLLLVPVILLAADFVAWRLATDRLRSAYLQWQASLATKGWQVTADQPIATGWPVAALLRLDNMHLAQATQGGFGWSAPAVRFGIALLHPHQLEITPLGDQTLSTPGWPDIHFRADRLAAYAPISAPIQSAHAEAINLAVQTNGGDAIAEAATITAAWQPGILNIQLAAGPITLPPSHHWGLGQTVTAAGLSLNAHGTWPATRSTTAATAWRDSGGALDLSQIRLQWGTLDIAGSGHAVLDDTLQPDATLDLKVADPAAALSTLADAGAISRGMATAAGAILSLLAIPTKIAGSPGVLPLPLQLHGGAVTLGQIPLLRVPPLIWTGP